MLGRFGSREICDVTFKAAYNDQKVGNKTFKEGQPVFVIDTATTSSMEQATTTVYAQGGRGYNRLVSWEGEKTMTFSVTDALISPMGLALLSGAGFSEDSDKKHVHITLDLTVTSGKATIEYKTLAAELGTADAKIYLCNDTKVKPYACKLDANGAITDWADVVKFVGSGLGTEIEVSASKSAEVGIYENEGAASPNTSVNGTYKFDLYAIMTTGATEIKIQPSDFGGYFYVEADTLYRNESGKDMAATITFPKVKIQSGFTIQMAATGDPSTFDFVMDAFPAYTYFDHTKKVVCDITIVSGAVSEGADGIQHNSKHESVTA